MELASLKPRLKTGQELFLGVNVNLTLLNFWQWAASDLVSNTTRGLLAEFIVAAALGLTSEPREEWRSFDLLTTSGRKIE
ncbi:MAG TPA: hypothetical protein VFP71_13140 [Candidatus Angelobacter sp.]|nr:hypothetical protein [Candidatus Angelobacter sp.]